MHRSRSVAIVAASAGLALSLGVGSVAAADGSVAMAGFAFDPATITVEVGDSVTWRNEDSAPHTATADDGSFDTGNVASGADDSVTFDRAGTFAYTCTIHPSMRGTVVVQAAASGGGATVTPAPTDAVPPPSRDRDDATGPIAGLLAVLGVAMLAATVAFDRRAGGRRA
jgi:plastocyanin